MGGDKDGERVRRRDSQQFDFPHGLRKMSPVEEGSVSNKVQVKTKEGRSSET